MEWLEPEGFDVTKQKKTDIWMPLYVGEYVADTMSFTTDQHGAYLLLLMALWREKGKPLQDNDEDLATITRLPLDRWLAIKPKILAKFIVGADGSITHKRAAQEVARAQDVSEKRVAAGKAGAEKRWQKDGKPIANAIADATPDGSQNDRQSQSQSPTSPETSSGEVGAEAPPSAVILIPLLGREEFAVTEGMVNEWAQAFPAVDVPQQLRSMRQWCLANASNRKTQRGVRAFIVRWLTKEQDRGRHVGPRVMTPSANETPYQRSMRERMEEATGGHASRRVPGAIDTLNVIEGGRDAVAAIRNR